MYGDQSCEKEDVTKIMQYFRIIKSGGGHLLFKILLELALMI